jgi:light-regulated signal transduction histidine kinase (bacteriophytochrome)
MDPADHLAEAKIALRHDLKAPLHQMRGFARLIERRYGGQLDEAGAALIANLVAAADNMERLVDKRLPATPGDDV